MENLILFAVRTQLAAQFVKQEKSLSEQEVSEFNQDMETDPELADMVARMRADPELGPQLIETFNLTIGRHIKAS